MKRNEFKRPPIQTSLLIQYFVTNMHNTNLPGVNSKDVRILLFDNDQILLYYKESVVANLIRLHVSLYDLMHTDAERFFLWRRMPVNAVGPKGRRRRTMTHVFVRGACFESVPGHCTHAPDEYL